MVCIHNFHHLEETLLPLIPAISAGFPIPASDFIDIDIDLSKELIKNPSSTFLGRVRGESMIEAGIDDGDILVIDKSIPYSDGKIAVCFINGEFTCKRIKIDKDGLWLVAENPNYKPIWVDQEDEFIIWGIVSKIIKYV